MPDETTTTTQTQGEPITKIISGDSVYPIRDAGALRNADGSVAGTNIADGAVTEEKLSESVNEKLDKIGPLEDSVSLDLNDRVSLVRRAGWVALQVKNVESTGTTIGGYDTFTLGTVPDGWRPKENVMAPVAIRAPRAGASAYLFVSVSGIAYVQNWSSISIMDDFVAMAMWTV